MFKGRFQITSVMFILLWFVGVNHCAFETLFFGANSSTNECPAHESGDPASHTEGQPCVSKFVNTHTLPVIAPSLIYVNFVSNLFIKPISSPSQIDGAARKGKKEFEQNYRNPLISLSIASNAPPLSI